MNVTLKQPRQLVVRLAENQLEIERALALRYHVFNQEMELGLAASHATGKDRDEFDLYCDHLIVVDEAREGEVVGTYRLLKGAVARRYSGFYSSSEFDLSGLSRLDGEVAEIGRSCVHLEYRDGSVISMLWNGLAQYMLDQDVHYLMGCGSVTSVDPAVVSATGAYILSKDAVLDLPVKPRAGRELVGYDPQGVLFDKASQKLVPALVKGYVRAGSRLALHPSVDLEFGTTDFFIFFERKAITARYSQKFMEK